MALTDCEERLARVTDDGQAVVAASTSSLVQAAVLVLLTSLAAAAAEILLCGVATTAQSAGESLADAAECD